MTAGDLAPNEKLLGYGFSIAGTQKSGTSSLSALLDQHLDVRRAPRKEMHFFDDDSRDWASPDYTEYQVVARLRHRIVGDASPSYLWWPQAMERMHAYNPDMKIIGIFRDPIERLFSQWTMIANRWPRIAAPWSTFTSRYDAERLPDRVPEGVKPQAFRLHSGVVRGFYGEQLERAIRLFGPDQVRALEFRGFLRDHTSTLDDLTEFLEIPPFRNHPELPHAMRGKPVEVAAGPTGEEIASLVETYRQDFGRFRELSGLDVSRWPIQQVIDGDLDPEKLAADLCAKLVITPAE